MISTSRTVLLGWLLLATIPAIATAAAPGQPGTPTASVSGSSVTIAWTPPASGDPQAYYVIIAGTSPGASNLGTFNVGLSTSVSAASLANGAYYVRVAAVNGDGQGPASAEVSFNIGTFTVPPGQPGTPTAVVSGNTVTVSWTAPATGGAPTSYTIIAGTTPGGSELGSYNLGLTLSISAPLPAGTYYVRIVAGNAAGSGPASNEVSFTIGGGGGPPGAPAAPTATVSGTSVTITWGPPSTGGAPTYYVILAGTSPGGTELGSFNLGSLTSITAPLPAGTYYIRIIAGNAAGQGAPSPEVSFTISAGGGGSLNGTWQGTTSQGVPIAFIVSNGQVTLISAGGAFNGGSCTATTQVSVNVSINGNQFSHTRSASPGSVGWSLQGTFSSSDTATGTLNATASPSATFSCSGTITATWTASNYGVGAPFRPRAPVGFNASVSGSTVNFSWFAPFSSDPPVTQYVLEVGTTSGASNVGTFTFAAPATTYALSTLTPGTYYARLRARNAAGDGPASSQATFTIAAAPGAPANFAVSVSFGVATFTWSAPASGGTPNSYDVEIGTSSGASDVGIFSAFTTSYVRVMSDGTYYARVKARNGAGVGPASNEITFFVGPPAPGAPTNLTVNVVGTTADLSWFPPSGAGVPASYDIEIGTSTGASNTGVFSSTTTNYSATLTPGTYYARVKGRNATGVGPASNEVSFTIAAALVVNGTWEGTSGQGAVIGFIVTNGRITDLLISGVFGGCTSTSRMAARDFAIANNAFNASENQGTFSFTLQGTFASESSASGTVQQTRSLGCFGSVNTTWTATNLGVGAPFKPGPPGTLSRTVAGSDVTFNWPASSTVFGTPDDYVVEIGTAPGGSDVGTFATTNLTYMRTLTPGTYYARVKARNSSGTGPASNEVTFTIVPALLVNGTWEGTSGQGSVIGFIVTNGRITELLISGVFGGCTSTSRMASRDFAITNNAFNASENQGTFSFTLQGTFASESSASGTVQQTRSLGCFGSVNTTWTASNLGVGAPFKPGAPGTLSRTIAGSDVTFNWSASSTVFGTPDDYVVEIGTAPGGSEIGTFATTNLTYTRTLTAGTYYARVKARNTSGTGPASNQVIFTIP